MKKVIMKILFIFIIKTFFLLGSQSGTTNIVEIPKFSQPAYLESYTDPVFGAKVTRITGEPGTVIPNVYGVWGEIARHHYSKDSAWNSDQTLIYLQRHKGIPKVLFLDGNNYNPLFGYKRSPGTDSRWHPKKPDIMVYVKDNIIGYWNVRQNTTQIEERFAGYSDFKIGPWEGNLSLDGRFIVVIGEKGADRVAFAFDLENKIKYPDLILNDISRVGWISISPSGKYIVLKGRINSKKGDQTQVYDLKGNKVGVLWHEYGRPSHYDLTIDENGDDIAVGVSKSKPDNGRVIKRRLYDGKVTVLTPSGYASHTSTRNVKRPGWAYVTYSHRNKNWPPYWDEVVAVKLDGSMITERIAHMHTKKVDYLTEAHAVPSPDGKRVLWASTWENETGRPIGTYVAERFILKE